MHKYRGWKAFLKGFFDTYADRTRCLVTGSSRLDVFRRGGDSLAGRYFTYRLHPFSIAEVARTKAPSEPIRPPKAISDEEFAALWEHGGFPEPFLKRDARFTRRWQRLRAEQLLRGDVRDLTQIQDLARLEVFATLLACGLARAEDDGVETLAHRAQQTMR